MSPFIAESLVTGLGHLAPPVSSFPFGINWQNAGSNHKLVQGGFKHQFCAHSDTARAQKLVGSTYILVTSRNA